MLARGNRFPLLLIGVAALLLVATSAMSIYGSAVTQESIRAASHSNQVIHALRAVGVSLGRLEGELRGYSVSANPVFASRYEAAVIGVREQVQALYELLDHDAVHRDRLRSFEVLLEERFEADREVMISVMANEGGAGESINAGVAFGEALRNHLDQMLESQMALQVSRDRKMQDSIAQTIATVVIANALAIVAVLIAFFITLRAQKAWRREQEAAMDAAQAIEASRQKSQFLASMSHEIRTPMNAIFGFTQLLEQKVQGAEERQYIRAITTSGRTLLALINDILDLSKIEADRLELVQEPVGLYELVDGAVAVFAQMAADKQISLQADMAADLPATLELDPNRIRQVLFNLIGNAVKFTDEGGVLVRVSGQRSGRRRFDVRFEVLDTGVGIPPDRVNSIFDPFVQVEGGDGETRDGTGLGLSIAKRLAELMGGEITVSSRAGEGTSFVVTLPNCKIERRRSPREQTEIRNFDELPAAKVLVVDDVDWNRELIQAHLEDSHHETLFATDGEDALRQARTQHPDLILMDIRMPRMDGREALQHLRADPGTKDIKVVAVTASSLSSEESTLRRDFDGYLRKPFTQAELFEAIAQQLCAAEAPDEDDEEAAVEDVERDQAIKLDGETEAQLRELLENRWPRLRGSMRMREAAAFGAAVALCGENISSKQLAAYGNRMTEAAQRFDITTAQSLIEQFPAQVSRFVKDQEGVESSVTTLSTDTIQDQ